MTFTVSPWLVWAGASLVLFGVWFVLSAVGDGLRELWGWVRRDRVTPLLEDDLPWCEECGGWHRWSHEDYPDLPPMGELLGLPPERTWEQMTSHQLPMIVRGNRYDHAAHDRQMQERIMGLDAPRERRAPEWEVDQRQHYAAMGFDYPSGLMARVRELTP